MGLASLNYELSFFSPLDFAIHNIQELQEDAKKVRTAHDALQASELRRKVFFFFLNFCKKKTKNNMY